MPLVFRRLRLPAVVGPLLGGVLLGPYGFGVVDPEWPTVDLFASVGRIFLMFIAGLEIDMRVFRKRDVLRKFLDKGWAFGGKAEVEGKGGTAGALETPEGIVILLLGETSELASSRAAAVRSRSASAWRRATALDRAPSSG